MIGVGTIEDYARDVEHGVYDHTNNGECSCCGDCCSNLLPLSKSEIERIRKHIKKHRIKAQVHLIPTMAVHDLTCPFLDLSKATEKCTIYGVRPAICRVFKCNESMSMDDIELFNEEPRIPVNVRKVFLEIRHGLFGSAGLQVLSGQGSRLSRLLRAVY